MVAIVTEENDLDIGNRGGAKIYEKVINTKATFWRQLVNFTITTSEEITRIVVTDVSLSSANTAKLVDGGIGEKTVTLELQTAEALNGLNFLIEVFGAPLPIRTTQKPKYTKAITASTEKQTTITTTEKATTTTEVIKTTRPPLFRIYKPVGTKLPKLATENIAFLNPTMEVSRKGHARVKLKNEKESKRHKVVGKRPNKSKSRSHENSKTVKLANEAEAYTKLLEEAELKQKQNQGKDESVDFNIIQQFKPSRKKSKHEPTKINYKTKKIKKNYPEG